VERAATLSRHASLIKLADKACNLRDVVGDPPLINERTGSFVRK
jgi:hypothetical protein